MKKVKVLQVNKYFYPVIGGIEKVVYDIADNNYSDIEMKVLVANTSFQYEKSKVRNTSVIKVPSVGKLFSMPLVFPYPYYLLKENPDIIHIHFPFPIGEISTLLYLLFKRKAKIIVTWHSDIIKQKKLLKIYSPFLNLLLKKADLIIATSPNMVNNSQYLSKFKEKCKVIPLGIDTSKYQSICNKRSYNSQANNILFVGRLVYYKGINVLIEAMRLIDENYKLTIVGNGPDQASLDKQIRDYGLNHRVKIANNVSDNDIIKYYAEADLFVLPSVEPSEAFGIVQVEAMASGLPVISTNIPTGVPFVNKNNETGKIVEPNNYKELATSIDEILKDKNLRRKYSINAHNRANSLFEIEDMKKNIYYTYHEVIS